MLRLNYIVFLLILNLSFFSYCQKDVRVYINAIDYETKHKLEQVNVLIYENEILRDSLFKKTKKPVKFKLKPGKTYNVFISKQGKVARHLEYDLGNVTKKFQNEKIISKVIVSLFDEVKKVDYKFIKENPFAEYYYDTLNKKLVFRYEQAVNMSKYVYNKFINAEEQAKQNGVLYEKAIKLADSSFLANNYSKALEYYISASHLDKIESYPLQQIEKITSLVKANEANEVAKANNKEENNKKILILNNDFKLLSKNIEEYKRNKVLKKSQLPDGVVFTVQIGAYRKIIPEINFKKVKPVYLDEDIKGLRRYITGSFITVDAANKARLDLVKLGYKDAFVTVYYNKVRIKFEDLKKL